MCVFLAKYGFFEVWQGSGWGGLWSPPLPSQDPFYPGAPKPFPGCLVFSIFPPLPSSGSRAAEAAQDSPLSGAGLTGGRPTSFLKSAPMVGGGPLPKGKGLKKGVGGGVVKALFFFAKYGFFLVWQGAGWGDQWSPPLPGQDPFTLGVPYPFPGFFGFSIFPPLPSSGSRAVNVVQDSPPSGAGLAGGRPSSSLKSAPMVGGGPLPKGRGGFAPYKRRGLLLFLRARNNRGKATPWPPTLLAVGGEGVGGKPLGNNPEQVLNLGYFLAVAGFPSLDWGCGPVTKIKNAVFFGRVAAKV
jgi:hypothetical protein